MKIMTLMAVGALVAVVACGGKTETPPAQQPTQTVQPDKPATTPAVADHAIASDEIGKDFVCPVMGNKGKVSRNTPAMEYMGKVYYFCCADCPEQFRANPAKFTTAVAHDTTHSHM